MPRSCCRKTDLFRGPFLLFRLFSHQGNLFCIARQFVGRLQTEGQMFQRRMPHHAGQRLQTDFSFADAGMPILSGAQRVLAVIQVNRLQSMQTQNTVKLLQHTVQISDDVIPAV